MQKSAYFQLPQGELLIRPGVYKITNLLDGKCYIGVSIYVKHRVSDHAKSANRNRKGLLGRAISKHGIENFTAEALCYMLVDDRDELLRIEAEMIKCHNSIEYGYNLVENWMGGRGEHFLKTCREAHNTPEYIAKRILYFADEEKTLARAKAIRASFDANNSRAKMSAAQSVVQNDPAHKEKMREIYDNPEFRTKLREVRKKQAPKNSAWMSKAYENPEFRAKQKEGARKAVEKDPLYGLKRSRGRQNTIAITDGKVNKWLKLDQPMPEGFYRGWKAK